MPIDLAKVIDTVGPAREYQYNEDDVIRYALSIGAGDTFPENYDELELIYESSLRVFPTFGVLPAAPCVPDIFGFPGLDIAPQQVLHGTHYLQILQADIPLSGSILSTPKIVAVQDKGKGTIVVVEITSEFDGQPLFLNRFGLYVRGETGSGDGGSIAERPLEQPGEPANAQVTKQIPNNQAWLYRLTGDRNPLHADPTLATMLGFDGPILHGLCTLGYAVRSALTEDKNHTYREIDSIQVRFNSHIYPGEALVTSAWRRGSTTVFESSTPARPKSVLSKGQILFRDK